MLTNFGYFLIPSLLLHRIKSDRKLKKFKVLDMNKIKKIQKETLPPEEYKKLLSKRNSEGLKRYHLENPDARYKSGKKISKALLNMPKRKKKILAKTLSIRRKDWWANLSDEEYKKFVDGRADTLRRNNAKMTPEQREERRQNTFGDIRMEVITDLPRVNDYCGIITASDLENL